MRFESRKKAGEELAEKLSSYQDQPVVVFALPRGGVVLGKELARRLHAPLDLLIPRKIGHPDNPEYAIAAVTENGEVVSEKAQIASVEPHWFREEVKRQRQEAARRRIRYLADRSPIDVKNKTGIIIDDGIATGLTMKAAINELKTRGPLAIIIAVPVAPQDTIHELEKLVDQVVVLEQPVFFLGSIGAYYQTFDQVTDEEVIDMLMDSN